MPLKQNETTSTSQIRELIPSYLQLRTLYVSAETKPDIRKLAEEYGESPSAVQELCSAERWELLRKQNIQDTSDELRKQITLIKIKAEANTVSRASNLQKRIYEKMMKDMDDGLYVPSVRDFKDISSVLGNSGGQGAEVNFQNNKVLNITISKPVDEMTFEEIENLEKEIKSSEMEEVRAK